MHIFYDGNGSPVAMIYNGTRYFYVRNAQGDVVGLTNNTGTGVVSYSYDAWGKILTITGSKASTIGKLNPLRYRGYVYDTETGLYYLGSRYYDPGVGRFINADTFVSTGQGILGHNMFVYCLNNPVNYLDKTGCDAETIAIEWGSTMWWLPLIDGPLPCGDLIYGAGLIILGLLSLSEPSDLAAVCSAIKIDEFAADNKEKAKTPSKEQTQESETSRNERKRNVNKNESPVWKKLNNVKNSKLKTSGVGKHKRYYEWDYTHNDIETYNYRGEHLGSTDSVTGELYKPSLPKRIDHTN